MAVMTQAGGRPYREFGGSSASTWPNDGHVRSCPYPGQSEERGQADQQQGQRQGDVAMHDRALDAADPDDCGHHEA
jgi:hypothetical protein